VSRVGDAVRRRAYRGYVPFSVADVEGYVFFFKQKTAYEIGLGIPAEPLFRSVLDGIITTIMATIQRINIIGSREGSRNRRRLKANQTGKKFRVGIKSNISTNRNNLISGVDRCIHLNAMK